jgi:hypothetical protein
MLSTVVDVIAIVRQILKPSTNVIVTGKNEINKTLGTQRRAINGICIKIIEQ